jgi:hypothetical protein
MIDPELLSAFLATHFIIVSPKAEITLRVGERNTALDDLLTAFGVTSCAFITAWNPGSVRLTDAENMTRQVALIAEVRRRGLPFLLGRGQGEDGRWPPEDSILVMGINRTEASALGALFNQLAIVFAESQEAVQLLLCR